MDKGLLPRRYAKALYKFALEKGQTKKVYAIMQNIAAAFATNPDMNTVMSNPFVSDNEKDSLITTAAGGKNDILGDFVKLLIKNNRIDIIRIVVLEYISLYRRENNIYHVEITSAATLKEADCTRLKSMVERSLEEGATAEFVFDVESALIGGFVVNIDNRRLDASVSNELKELRLSLIK